MEGPHSSQSNNVNLEDQLRSMIIGNVQMSQQQQPGSQHGSNSMRPQQRTPHSVSYEKSSPILRDSHIQPFHNVVSGSALPETLKRQQAPQDLSHPPQTGGHGRVASTYGHRGPTNSVQPSSQPLPRHKWKPLGLDDSRISGSHFPYGQPPRILQRPSPQVPDPFQGSETGSLIAAIAPNAPRTLNRAPFLSQQQVLHGQCSYLDEVAAQEIPLATMSSEELAEKELFRATLEQLCHTVTLGQLDSESDNFGLLSFGSLASGFATRGSDMDLMAVTSIEDASLPRLLEKKFLDVGYGARCLTRTRVPILKVCEKPTAELFSALGSERQKWETLPPEERDKLPENGRNSEGASAGRNGASTNEEVAPVKLSDTNEALITEAAAKVIVDDVSTNLAPTKAEEEEERDKAPYPGLRLPRHLQQHQQNNKPWFRERKLGPLDFPKEGVGIQCDINFGNALGLHNTTLLRCYSLCDARVRPMIVFVKAWAKRRTINSSYNGTLSSYGYVLMVLHYLVNVAYPPVVPNLQLAWKPPQHGSWTSMLQEDGMCDGYNVRFWRNEDQIRDLAAKGMLTHNTSPLARLLRDFFTYYAQPAGGFSWMHDVLSLRTPGGLLSKQSKGWTGAKTEVKESAEVRHRYLFAIEDPFELDHNVARTVTHNGVVAIRDEFRRAWRILGQVGRGQRPEGELFDLVVEQVPNDGKDAEHRNGVQEAVETTAQAVAPEGSRQLQGA